MRCRPPARPHAATVARASERDASVRGDDPEAHDPPRGGPPNPDPGRRRAGRSRLASRRQHLEGGSKCPSESCRGWEQPPAPSSSSCSSVLFERERLDDRPRPGAARAPARSSRSWATSGASSARRRARAAGLRPPPSAPGWSTSRSSSAASPRQGGRRLRRHDGDPPGAGGHEQRRLHRDDAAAGRPHGRRGRDVILKTGVLPAPAGLAGRGHRPAPARERHVPRRRVRARVPAVPALDPAHQRRPHDARRTGRDDSRTGGRIAALRVCAPRICSPRFAACDGEACARHDSNMRPLPPQGSALSPELRALGGGQCSWVAARPARPRALRPREPPAGRRRAQPRGRRREAALVIRPTALPS